MTQFAQYSTLSKTSWSASYLLSLAVRVIATVLLMVFALKAPANAEIVAVPFKEGFVGTIGTNNTKANNVTTFADLGLQAAIVQQLSSGTVFESPNGNDVPVDLVLFQGSDSYVIPGSINWEVKYGGTMKVFGFTPDTSRANYSDITLPFGESTFSLGRVDKRDSHRAAGMIQTGIYNGDQLGTRSDVGRGMGVL